jgi:hypothetical protein
MVPNKYTTTEDFDGVLKVPYLGGNGGAYDGTAPVSIDHGLQMELIGGRLAIGGGELMYHITGRPTVNSPTTTPITINFLGKTCSSISVGSGESPLNLRNLEGGVPPNNYVDVTTPMGQFTELSFGTITIPESGSYAFSLRLYGHFNSNVNARNPFYIYLQRNAATAANIIDAAEFDIVTVQLPVAGYADYSYSITLGGYFNAGETAVISMAQGGANWHLKSEPTSTNPIRTSLVYWKL